jgi:hypothetical protein
MFIAEPLGWKMRNIIIIVLYYKCHVEREYIYDSYTVPYLDVKSFQLDRK